MTNPTLAKRQPAVKGVRTVRLRATDPILTELYAVRAKLNAEAGYSVKRVLEIARLEAEQFASRPATQT